MPLTWVPFIMSGDKGCVVGVSQQAESFTGES
jgi:hypothetical protein